MRECLVNICRLCRGIGAAGIGRRNPHSKDKYGGLILRALQVDVSEDSPSCHPPFICHNCYTKIQRWWKGVKQKKNSTCKIEVAQFTAEHSCNVCSPTTDILSSFRSSIKEHADQHELLTLGTKDQLRVMRFNENGQQVIVLLLERDMSWKIVVCEFDLDISNSVFSDVPPVLGLADVPKVFGILASIHVCRGNSDFRDVVESRKGPRGQIPVSITGSDVCQSYPFPTIRHKKCVLLTDQSELSCWVCRAFRVDLHVIASRLKQSPKAITTSSTTRNDALTHSQLLHKVKIVKEENRCLKKRNTKLLDKIDGMIHEESDHLTKEHDAIIRQAMMESDDQFTAIVPDESPAKLMWQQQKEAIQKGKRMRWHPAIIRFCIALQTKSTATYNLLRQTGFLKLPHPNTLHGYTHFGNPVSGFNSDLMLRILADNNVNNLPAHERNISILFDEMKIKSGLVYSVRSGSVVGFVDVGSIGNEILQFESRCRGDEKPVASHVLVLMIRGICSSLRTPIGYYPSHGVTSFQLYPCLWEAVMLLEAAGFTVRTWVSDGASPNRKLYRMHGDPSDALTNSTKNLANTQTTRQLYFICDVPHLLKTTRNNWENSGCHNKTRHLHYQKQDISWNQLRMLYDWDVGLDRISPGLRRLHKLTHEHLHLTPALRMRVYMATQVLSSSVANAFQAFGRHDTASTELFVSNFDQFFDCLNVSNPLESRHKRKAALAPYRSVDDWRFKWLKEDFLGFLASWENEAANHQGASKEVQLKMCLSRETLEGIRITVNSFVELAKLLLQEPGVEYLLSEKLNQDPLEMYFSKQRSSGGSNENPTAEQFGHNMMSLYVASSCVKGSKRGNCRKDDENQSSIDATPLPKRQKKK